MATAPAGFISLAEDYLRETIAASAQFQSITETANQAAAKAHTYLSSLPEPTNGIAHTRSELETYRPFAVVGIQLEDGVSLDRIAADNTSKYLASYEVLIHLERDIPGGILDPVDRYEIHVTWMNIVGTIMGEMAALFRPAGYIDVQSFGIALGPFRPDKEDVNRIGNAQAVVLRATCR